MTIRSTLFLSFNYAMRFFTACFHIYPSIYVKCSNVVGIDQHRPICGGISNLTYKFNRHVNNRDSIESLPCMSHLLYHNLISCFSSVENVLSSLMIYKYG